MNYLAICLVAATLVSGVLSSSSSCQRDSRFDVALLSVQWAPGVCASASCVDYTNEFTIHGLWPNYFNNSYPEYCCYQTTLNKAVLEPIVDDMQKNWRSLYASDSWSFWIHEWQKHGTCTSTSVFKGQFTYFNKTLGLFEELDAYTMLTSAGIEPSKSGVALETVREAFRKGFGKRPQIACSGSSSGLPIMTEVRFCYDPKTLAHVDCPVESKSCKSKTGQIVIIPA